MARVFGRYLPWVGACLIVAMVAGLYGPFLANPRVFDDGVFFSGYRFSYYSTHPFGFDFRLPPYFTLAVTEILVGGMQAHRIVSLLFHAGCALALYKLILDLLHATSSSVPVEKSSAPDLRPVAWAFVAASLFALNPVAVYGAAYLVERTIVLATLFSLLSLILFARGIVRSGHADAVSAALLYTIAVLCKEHSILLPAAAVMLVPLIGRSRNFSARYALTYLTACAPVAIFVTLGRKWLIGRAYEPDYSVVAGQLESVFGHAIDHFSWALSAVTQAGLFFRYLALWLWPNTDAMSIDMRIDFLATWSAAWIALKIVCFLAFGGVGLWLLRRGGRVGMVGFGLLYVWILFLAEFSTARFQEPFVLYRSYLWAPGIAIALAAALGRVSLRGAIAVIVLAAPVLWVESVDRLHTFSSPFLLWQDAVAKLPGSPVPWGSRTLYMMAREYMSAGRSDKAVEMADRCMAEYPETVHCYFARGFIRFLSKQYELALPDVAHAVQLQPKSGIGHHRLGLVLEQMGRTSEAISEYRRAEDLGFSGSALELKRLLNPSTANRSASANGKR
jgi:hypothetical protein